MFTVDNNSYNKHYVPSLENIVIPNPRSNALTISNVMNHLNTTIMSGTLNSVQQIWGFLPTMLTGTGIIAFDSTLYLPYFICKFTNHNGSIPLVNDVVEHCNAIWGSNYNYSISHYMTENSNTDTYRWCLFVYNG